MSRFPQRIAAFLVLALVPGFALSAKKPEKEAEGDAAPAAFSGMGVIVDCADYLLRGNADTDRRFYQSNQIDSGMPACFIAEDGHLYLLFQDGAQARDKFQPTPNFILGRVTLEGTAFQKGSLRAIAVTLVGRTGPYTDRESRTKTNPEPNRPTEIKPKKPDEGKPPHP